MGHPNARAAEPSAHAVLDVPAAPHRLQAVLAVQFPDAQQVRDPFDDRLRVGGALPSPLRSRMTRGALISSRPPRERTSARRSCGGRCSVPVSCAPSLGP